MAWPPKIATTKPALRPKPWLAEYNKWLTLSGYQDDIKLKTAFRTAWERCERRMKHNKGENQ